jgi:hypothetical protein
MLMKGIKYLVDEAGKPEAVVLDLKTHGRLWEDIQDILVSKARLKEPRIPLEEVVADLRKKGKLKSRPTRSHSAARRSGS